MNIVIIQVLKDIYFFFFRQFENLKDLLTNQILLFKDFKNLSENSTVKDCNYESFLNELPYKKKNRIYYFITLLFSK